MDKFLLFSFLGMLIVVHHGVAGNVVIDDIGMLEELDQICWEMEEENEMESSPISSWTSERGSKVLVNVDSFGAVGDGVSDDTQVNLCSLIKKHSYIGFRCINLVNEHHLNTDSDLPDLNIFNHYYLMKIYIFMIDVR